MAKLALCVGINNYPGTGLDLSGCVNDAKDWGEELDRRGFSVTQLLDSAATKAALTAAIRSVVGRAAKGDVVVITFSGHGTFVPDRSGDETDGLDEGLCPYDLQTGGGALIDDEIHALFAARKPGAKVVLISDSCHSGTVTRDADAQAADDVPRPRFMPMSRWLPAERLAGLAKPKPTAAASFAKALDSKSGDLLLSGCQEGPNNVSFDAKIKGRPNGAFTYYALKALKGMKSGATYADWHGAISPAFLPSAQYPQSPQIVGTSAARKQKIFE